MRIFRQNVPRKNRKHVDDTVTTARTVQELVAGLSSSALERSFFLDDPLLHGAFPDGKFNCWACPQGSLAKGLFDKVEIGDLVIFVRNGRDDDGIGDDDIRHIGVVRAKCTVDAPDASRILWPDSGETFPYIFFFHTEVGLRRWEDYCDDFGFRKIRDTRGYFRSIAENRIVEKWRTPAAYLEFLRTTCHFGPFATPSQGQGAPSPELTIPTQEDEDDMLRTAARLAATVRDIVAGAKGQQIRRKMKKKELRIPPGELPGYIRSLVERQNRRCAITGLPLKTDGKCDDSELAWSLDRIDSNGHYEKENLQVVCKFVNRWKNDDDDGEFRRLIRIIRSTESTQ